MFECLFRADYIDTDAMGVIHHASYLRYFEKSRVEWLRSMGQDYRELERQGWLLPLKSCSVEYFRPIHFDDEVRVIVSLGILGQASIEICYEVKCGTELSAKGLTHHALCRRKDDGTGKVRFVPTRIPHEWRQMWQQQNVKKF